MAGTETFGTDSGVGSTIALLEARLPEVRERRRQLEDELAAVVAQENAMVSVLQGLEALAETSLAGRSTTAAPAGGKPAEAAETADSKDQPDAAPAPAEPVGIEGVPAAEEPEPQAAPAKATRKRTATAPAGTTAAKKAATKKTTVRKTPSKKTATASAPATVAREQDAAAAPAPAKKATARGTAKKTAAKKTTARKAAVKKTAAAELAPSAQPQTASAPAAAPGRRRRTDAKSVLAVLTGADDSLRARQVAGLLGLDGTEAEVNAVRTTLERLAKSGTAQRTGRGLYATVSG